MDFARVADGVPEWVPSEEKVLEFEQLGRPASSGGLVAEGPGRTKAASQLEDLTGPELVQVAGAEETAAARLSRLELPRPAKPGPRAGEGPTPAAHPAGRVASRRSALGDAGAAGSPSGADGAEAPRGAPKLPTWPPAGFVPTPVGADEAGSTKPAGRSRLWRRKGHSGWR